MNDYKRSIDREAEQEGKALRKQGQNASQQGMRQKLKDEYGVTIFDKLQRLTRS